MDREAYLDRLDAAAEDSADFFEHVERRAAADRTYYPLPVARHGVERGTVIIKETGAVIRGYPSTPRILVLDTGIRSLAEVDSRRGLPSLMDRPTPSGDLVGSISPLVFLEFVGFISRRSLWAFSSNLYFGCRHYAKTPR